jgi:hypothetical protein
MKNLMKLRRFLNPTANIGMLTVCIYHYSTSYKIESITYEFYNTGQIKNLQKTCKYCKTKTVIIFRNSLKRSVIITTSNLTSL